MKKFIAKHPVITFCILSLALLPIIGGLNIMLFPSSFNYALIFPQWSPGLAAIIAAGILNGKKGISSLLRKVSIKDSKPNPIVIALIIPVVCCGIAYVILSFAETGQWNPPVFTRSVSNYAICLIATIFGCYGEEIGWRGFMLQKLNRKYSPFISSLIVGLFWGIWHLRFQIGLTAFGLFVAGVVCYSIIITWLCGKTKNNIFAAVVFHTAINMCSLILFENILSGITEQQTATQIANQHIYLRLYAIYAIVFAIPCLFVVGKMIKPNKLYQDA